GDAVDLLFVGLAQPDPDETGPAPPDLFDGLLVVPGAGEAVPVDVNSAIDDVVRDRFGSARSGDRFSSGAIAQVDGGQSGHGDLQVRGLSARRSSHWSRIPGRRKPQCGG